MVSKGYSQKPNTKFDPNGPYAPVACITLFQFLLAMVTILSWVFLIIDVQLAYLYIPLKETLYIKQPEGFTQGQDHVCRF